MSHELLSEELSSGSHPAPADTSSHIHQNATVDHGAISVVAGAPPSTGSVADGTLAKSRIHPRVFEMGAR